VSHWSNKCIVPPPTLKHSHASSSAQSVADAPKGRGSDAIVLQLSSALGAPDQRRPSSAACSTAGSAPESVASQGSRITVSEAAAAGDRSSVSSHASALPARPHSAHTISRLGIVVGCGERPPSVSLRKEQQLKYAHDLTQQIQMRSSIAAPAARQSGPVSTSLNFQPSEVAHPLSNSRERCPFQISKQVRPIPAQVATDRVIPI
jgi:hypothetical protein